MFGKSKKQVPPSQEEPSTKKRSTRANPNVERSSRVGQHQQPPLQEQQRELTWSEDFMHANPSISAPISERVAANLYLVREFYANAFHAGSNCKVYVRGLLVDYSGDAINRYLKIRAPRVYAYRSAREALKQVREIGRREIHGFVGRPGAPWYKYHGGQFSFKIHIHHFHPMIMEGADIDLGELLNDDISKIANHENSTFQIGHCNLITGLCRDKSVPELDEDDPFQPYNSSTIDYFNTFLVDPVPVQVQEGQVSQGEQGENVGQVVNEDANELMADIDGFMGNDIPAQQNEEPKGGFHYTYSEDEITRLLHDLDLYKAQGCSHLYFNPQGSLYSEAMRYQQEHPPPSHIELYPTRDLWQQEFMQNDRDRYDGVMARRNRAWERERDFTTRHPPASAQGQVPSPTFAPQPDFGSSQGYCDLEGDPSWDYKS
ncbi:hypothetical protein TSUD_90480 [Trifolium subterraneum]|uniref:Putative plant transposon protein domain-containing protein n=1 Tax=Trifolium subterraneum TaxID=3900 RepID=A0A2Z6PRN0_TRISU|nr:hypothetical protein TSUD_90480 [Trifolium subterraneum]